MEDQVLTPHFMLSEFLHSDTALQYGINNSINLSVQSGKSVFENLTNLCEKVLEPLRQQFNMPIIISSGYRCPELNNLVGGVPNSQHLTGEAADIIPSPLTPNPSALRDWFLWIMDNCPFDQLIWEKKGTTRWIHVSCCINAQKNRQKSFRLILQ